MTAATPLAQPSIKMLLDRLPDNASLAFGSGRMDEATAVLPVAGVDDEAIWRTFAEGKCVYISLCFEDRRFGGNEEGGWWHDLCDVLFQAPAFSYMSLIMLVDQYRRIEANEGRYGINSVRSRGIFVIRISSVPLEDESTPKPRYS